MILPSNYSASDLITFHKSIVSIQRLRTDRRNCAEDATNFRTDCPIRSDNVARQNRVAATWSAKSQTETVMFEFSSTKSQHGIRLQERGLENRKCKQCFISVCKITNADNGAQLLSEKSKTQTAVLCLCLQNHKRRQRCPVSV